MICLISGYKRIKYNKKYVEKAVVKKTSSEIFRHDVWDSSRHVGTGESDCWLSVVAGRGDRDEMFLIGNGAACRIPDIESALHEFIVCQAFTKSATFNR